MNAAHPSRRVCLCAALGCAAALAAPATRAQGERAVRFVLPNPAGSGVDTIIRSALPELSKALGQPVVIDNQPGAGGVIGLQTLARAAPDGSTLSLVSNNVVVLPSVLKSMPFRMPGDFTPITVVGHSPLVLVVNPRKIDATSSQAFIRLLKARPGELTFGSGGTGTILHLAPEMFLSEAQAEARHIPYKGVSQMVTDLVGGQLDFAVIGLVTALPYVKSGQLRAIGVSSPARSPSAPEIPTFVEQGLPGYVIDGWFAVLGPRGLPAAQVARVHDAFATAFAAPEVRQAMARQGNVIDVSTPGEAQAYFRSEGAKLAAIARKAGVAPQ